MKIRPDRPAAAKAAPQPDDLLRSRMSMLGLDFDAIQTGDRTTCGELVTRCADCEVKKACRLDLARDPNDPVWEGYCPNSVLLNGLTETWWAARLS